MFVVWVFGWLVGRRLPFLFLIEWTGSCLARWLFGWAVGFLIDRVFGWLDGWSVCWLFGQLAGWQSRLVQPLSPAFSFGWCSWPAVSELGGLLVVMVVCLPIIEALVFECL